MVGNILHRGDITDPVVEPMAGAAMATRRLRIVDAAHAVQPMASCDERVVVAFNGEIYNHATLRVELEGLGARFRTESDTEVLANALRFWGHAALRRIIGMYAFVAIEPATGEFLAARDPFGLKPLYLIREGGGYLFCSEVRPLLQALDRGDVMFVPPGHMLTRRALVDFASPEREWPQRPRRAPDPRELDRALQTAVERRIPPNLPFATFFSGGIDSTLVAHYAHQVRPEAPGYFLGGEDAPDFPYAARYAETTGYDLRLVPLDPQRLCQEDLIRCVVESVESFEPEVVRNGLCTYLLAEQVAADGVRVALCGEGADELFAGYVPLELAFAQDAALGENVRSQCLSSMHRTNLQRLDRCTMRFAVEMREPFLDGAVAEYALSLDAASLVSRRDGLVFGKQPLRALYDLHPDRLPAMIRDRRKKPFNEGTGFDVSQALSPWRAMAEQAVSDADLRRASPALPGCPVDDKEDIYYLRLLSDYFDVSRVPHLRLRNKLSLPDTFLRNNADYFAATM